jgi:hypothetical protein
MMGTEIQILSTLVGADKVCLFVCFCFFFGGGQKMRAGSRWLALKKPLLVRSLEALLSIYISTYYLLIYYLSLYLSRL